MKTKMIGIALAALMLASVFAAFAPMGSAVSVGDNFNHIYADTTVTYKVLVGQDVQFEETGTNPWTNADNVKVQKFSDGIWYDYRGPWTDGKAFDVDWDPDLTLRATDGTVHVSLSVQTPNIPLTLKVGTKTVSTTTVGANVITDVGGINLFPEDHVDLVVIGPDGQIKTDTINNQNFTNITVGELTSKYGSTSIGIETAGWKLGSYTFQIKTKADYACGLDRETGEKTLTISKGEVDIAAEKTTAVQQETIKLTVTGVNGDEIKVSSESKDANFQGGTEDTPNDKWCAAPDKNCFTDKIDEDGKRTYAVKFNETGSYTIKVTVTAPVDRKDTYDTVDISVTEKAVTFDVPTTVVIGERFTLAGMANTGEKVDIAIENVVYDKTNDLVLDENGEFSVEIDTAAQPPIDPLTVPGSVRLKAYINRAAGATAIGTAETDDGSIAILLVRGGLTAEVSVPSVAQGDDLTISGTAKGSKSVNILVISPKGSGGDYIDGTDQGIYSTTTSVSETDNTFSKKINVGDDVDTGVYTIAVLSPGSDSVYNGFTTETKTEKFMENLEIAYNLNAKTQEQLLEIIMDATIDAAGSDDLLILLTVKVEAPYVRLDSIATVGIGQPMEVTGTTNREEGFAIVVTVKGPVELSPQTVLVENGKFNATFDTTDAKEGTYTVKADDGDGNTDETTASISGVAPTAAPTATPAATAAPTAAPTPVVTSPTPTEAPSEGEPEETTEEPGFEAVFAITGLLAVAYLVLRIKK